ncbi:MAG: hypothetical protein MUF54_24615 [Polyangiaceae bacterium]|nr:hypothetical protein [Polyangiaceae bacterium]
MEHLAPIIGRTLDSVSSSDDNVIPFRAPRTIYDLVELFGEEESHHNPDAVLPLSQLRMTPEENIAVPELGEFAFNDWSRKQLSSLLGLRWDRWFENAAPEERADEMNRRLMRAKDEVKIRTTTDIGADVRADGTLRGLVSPGFTPIEDTKVASLVVASMKNIDGEMKIIRADRTNRTTSFVVAIGKAYRVGGEGQVGDVWGGLLVRNSGVGYASLLMVAHLVRLMCKNGMICPIGDSELLRRRHRGLDESKMRWMLSDNLQQLPGRLRHAGEVLQLSVERQVADVEATVRGVLTQGNLPLRMLEPIMEAYGREPMPTAFGVSQAITRAAQRFSPEERLELEQAAGGYLRRLS